MLNYMSKPLVSVIIPCFNVGKTIQETLESVIKQTYPSFEVIVVIDGATDNTADIVKNIASQQSNIIVCEQENKGSSSARNTGFLQSSGEYIVFLDGDDLFAPTYLEACYSKFAENPEVGLVYTNTILFEAENGLLDIPNYSPNEILIDNSIPATALIRRDIFQAVGMCDTSLPYAEDWELWIRYTRYNENVVKIEEPLFYYRRRHSKDSKTDLNKINNISEQAQLYIYKKHYTLYQKEGLSVNELFKIRNEVFYLRKKVRKYETRYYGIWYRKLFYRLFKPNFYKSIFDR